MTRLWRRLSSQRRAEQDLRVIEAEQSRPAVEVAQQCTAVLLARREARERQRAFETGVLIVRGPQP
jgi:hypothetical protein